MSGTGMILTKRSREYFVDDGFKFTFDKQSRSDTSVTFWRCEFKNSKDKCLARIHVKDGKIIKRINSHTHASNPAGIEVVRIRNDIKKRAVQTQELPNQLINHAIVGASQAILGQLPKSSTMSKSIRRARNQAKHAPTDPQNTSDLIIPESYQFYNDERFLLIDTGVDDPNRILVFGRQSYENWAGQVKKLYVDGTFRICPVIFSQVFEILAARGNYVVPLFYALLPNKRRETYVRLFKLIRELRPGMYPDSIATDFEQAEFNAIKDVWPDSELHGCFFHLNQSMWRKVSNSGHKKLYDSNAEFKLCCKMIVALAFVPIQSLDYAFIELVNSFPDEFITELQDVLDWFEDYYLGRERQGRRRKPIFPPELWNLHQRVLSNEDRTNNFSEAAHKRMQKELCMDHPSIWRFIDGLRAVQSNRDKEYEEFVRGQSQSQKRRKFREADARIFNIVQGGFGTNGERTVVEYLRGLAHNFDMDV